MFQDKIRKFLSKAYRDGYLETNVREGIGYQIQALRSKFALSQAQFAEKTGKKQSTISRLENTEYGKVSVQTLIEIAQSLDIALIVRFADYPSFLMNAERCAWSDMQPNTIFETVECQIAEPTMLGNSITGWSRSGSSRTEPRRRLPTIATSRWNQVTTDTAVQRNGDQPRNLPQGLPSYGT